MHFVDANISFRFFFLKTRDLLLKMRSENIKIRKGLKNNFIFRLKLIKILLNFILIDRNSNPKLNKP